MVVLDIAILGEATLAAAGDSAVMLLAYPLRL
jgi:hypothetical protein